VATAEEEKKRKYLSTVELHHASSTPFVVSVDGALGHKALMFLPHLAERLSCGWGKSYSHVLMCMDLCVLGLCCYQGYQPLFARITCALEKWYQYR